MSGPAPRWASPPWESSRKIVAGGEEIVLSLSQQMIERGCAFDNGERVRLTVARVPVKLVVASGIARDEYTVQAGVHFGHEKYAVMQVVVPDPAGRFPGEPGCDAPWSEVPVLALS